MSLRPAWFKKLAVLLLALAGFTAVNVYAFGNEMKNLTENDFKRLRADSWRAVGNTLIIEGNVFLPVKNFEIYADQMVINMTNKDFEASGNIRFYRWVRGKVNTNAKELGDIEKRANTFIHSVKRTVSPWGEVNYSADVSYQSDQITADKISGNLATSFFQFENLSLRYLTFVCRAERAERRSDGVTIIKNGEISSCSYLESNNAHHSIAAAEIRLTPHEAKFYELKYADFDRGDCSVLLLNGTVKIYGVPVLCMPVFYKPKDESPGICGIQYGSSGDWGNYINLYRRISFSDAPNFRVKLLADWYERRGFGYGVDGTLHTAESRTDFFAYSIYDKNQYRTDDYDDYRLEVPHNRYDFRISNITHLTPRLDFRGSFEYQSDLYVRRDFFRSEYNRDPQPATFLALEQQFDHFSASLYARFRVNDFMTTVEKLPELRFDVPRQQILDSGFYYQGDLSAAYMKMKWIDFDIEPKIANYSKLRDYDTFRLDTTHFLYYPLATGYFTFVPRAGVKLTVYSDSSKHKVSTDELITMFTAADPEGWGREKFTGYDEKGGSKVRLAAELGFELSTKIHKTWQNVRSNLLQLDGLRHIMQPYVNYTFIPKPTVDRDKLLFFDDIDRIDEQNFFRLGLINRLQTRGESGIETLFRMENFWDIHMGKQDGMSALGNFGTILSMRILKGLTINTKILIDVSNDGEIKDTYRNGRNVGKTGLAQDWLNMWNFNITYAPAKNWKFTAGYNYIRPYRVRSAYSMGSTLTMINAASYFDSYYDDTEEEFYIGGTMPLTPDHRTLGTFRVSYDVPKGSIDDIRFAIIRQFHCWQLIATLGFEREYGRNDPNWDVEYSISANLTGLNPELNSVQNSVLRNVESMTRHGFKL